MEGYVGLFRCLLEKTIWENSTPGQKTILITLLLMVNHHEAEWEWKGEKFTVIPGQTVTSLEKISKKCGKGISIHSVRTALLRFEKLEFLTNESTKTGRLITIVNWGLYQTELMKGDKGTDKEVAKTRQRGDKEVASNKNDKKDNNDNNDKKKIVYAETVKMTEIEYNKLLEIHGEVKVKRMIEVLDNYKAANGKKYVNDYRAILNWVVDRVMKEGVSNGFKSKNSSDQGKWAGYKPKQPDFEPHTEQDIKDLGLI
jgi:hypothetical protein